MAKELHCFCSACLKIEQTYYEIVMLSALLNLFTKKGLIMKKLIYILSAVVVSISLIAPSHAINESSLGGGGFGGSGKRPPRIELTDDTFFIGRAKGKECGGSNGGGCRPPNKVWILS